MVRGEEEGGIVIVDGRKEGGPGEVVFAIRGAQFSNIYFPSSRERLWVERFTTSLILHNSSTVARIVTNMILYDERPFQVENKRKCEKFTMVSAGEWGSEVVVIESPLLTLRALQMDVIGSTIDLPPIASSPINAPPPFLPRNVRSGAVRAVERRRKRRQEYASNRLDSLVEFRLKEEDTSR